MCLAQWLSVEGTWNHLHGTDTVKRFFWTGSGTLNIFLEPSQNLKIFFRSHSMHMEDRTVQSMGFVIVAFVFWDILFEFVFLWFSAWKIASTSLAKKRLFAEISDMNQLFLLFLTFWSKIWKKQTIIFFSKPLKLINLQKNFFL